MEEYSRECLAIRAGCSIRSADVIEALAEMMVFRGVPDHIHSDNGGVYGPGCTRVARAGGSQDALHRAWVSVGERLHREFQREVEGRATGQGALLHVTGGARADGTVQADLQPGSGRTARWATGPPAPEALIPAGAVPQLAGPT